MHFRVAPVYDRFTLKSRHSSAQIECPPSARSGHRDKNSIVTIFEIHQPAGS